MKSLMFTSCLFVLALHAFGGNRIDSIKTKGDVSNFFARYRNDSNCHGACNVFRMPDGSFYNDFYIDTFYKIDIDFNGSTDLVFSGPGILAVVIDINGVFEYHILSGGPRPTYSLKELVRRKDCEMLVLNDYSQNIMNPHAPDTIAIDTVIYRSHGIVEYNAHANATNLHKIKYSMADCNVGDSCCGYDLMIDRKGNMLLTTKIFNDSERNFSKILDGEGYRELWSFLDYINIGSFKDRYIVPWSDPNGSVTTFFYSSIQKTVEDDGRIGTFALRRLYEMMNQIRFSEGWKKK